MESIWCKSCGGLSLNMAEHRCPPRWEVWAEDECRGEARIIYAGSAGTAAERRGQEEDEEGDYMIIRGDKAVYVVAALGCEDLYHFEVEAHHEPVYEARAVPSPEPA